MFTPIQTRLSEEIVHSTLLFRGCRRKRSHTAPSDVHVLSSAGNWTRHRLAAPLKEHIRRLRRIDFARPKERRVHSQRDFHAAACDAQGGTNHKKANQLN